MQLKGLVWFFTISLLIISAWILSYTIAVRNFESNTYDKALKLVKKKYKNLPQDQFNAKVESVKDSMLAASKDKVIYLGSTYQKCKETELNRGLDLQGGMSVTMDVNLREMVKKSCKPNDPRVSRALAAADSAKLVSDKKYTTLFCDAFIQQNGSGKLASAFSSGKSFKPTMSDDAVRDELSAISNGAIEQTYRIIQKRIDNYGVAQPNVNLDLNKGIINVELAGVKDPERVRKKLQSSANLQFWEVYNIDEIGNALVSADKALENYLNAQTDTSKIDSATIKKNANPLRRYLAGYVTDAKGGLVPDKNGKPQYTSQIGFVPLNDTGVLSNHIKNSVVTNVLPSNLRFLYGMPEEDNKGKKSFVMLYAIKTQPGTDKAPLEGDAIDNARQDYDEKGKPAIKMEMNPMGSSKWAALTRKNVGHPIAIVLDDIVYSAPNVNGPIEGGSSEISGNFTIEEAQELASTLNSGKVDAPARIVAEQIVGPTLGQEAVNGGMMAFLISFGVIFLLMLLYYSSGGWVANLALILNLLYTLGVLTALGYTLTAAGIAGLVLTIGMAVDTNVIIFERIKEELIRGKSYQQAVDDGYKRSMAPVLDAHVTSLLTAIILAFFGLGPVLGFAITQIIGLLLSLFCGILVSRLITSVGTSKNKHFNYFTSLSKSIFKKSNFKFIEKRKFAYVISSFVLIAGVASIFNGFHLGVEFKGGRSYTVSFDQKVNASDELRNSLKKNFEGDNITLKTVGNDGKQLNITTSYLIGQEDKDSIVQQRLMDGLRGVLPKDLTYSGFVANHIKSSITVQPSISKDLKRNAIIATIFATLIIFMYIFIRFRDFRYSAGTILTILHDVLITLAVFSFFKEIVPFPLELDQHFIAAVLTVIGFSMNDTVIVFDRIREYSRDMKGAEKSTIINAAINDTLSRTVMTSLTVFLTVLILFIFGGDVTRGFAFAMLIGVLTGTYSSIFVGAPVLVDIAKSKPLGAAKEERKKEKAPEL
jgi:SecD/SecF fusion protein